MPPPTQFVSSVIVNQHRRKGNDHERRSWSPWWRAFCTSAEFMNCTPVLDGLETREAPSFKTKLGKSQCIGVCKTLWKMTCLDGFCIQHISQDWIKCLLPMLLLPFPVKWLFETGKERGRSVNIQLNLQLIWRGSANTLKAHLTFTLHYAISGDIHKKYHYWC